MDRNKLKILLEQVKSGDISIDSGLEKLKQLPFEDLEFAKVDHHRSLRTGFPEVIFGQDKTPEQILEITERLAAMDSLVLATRVNEDAFVLVQKRFPNAVYHQPARCFTLGSPPEPANKGVIAVVSAGTADLTVAEEAAITAWFMGNPVERLYDVGVAGIHRLLNHRAILQQGSVIIVVAGMEGALASVVAGLTDKPVIGVPTSIGYGANFGGLSPLLTMLNSCATGIGVVNIDNGFGAATLAHAINSLGGKAIADSPL
ncbi:MAG: nickel pincer cofactor biosynthesis protein LarB [Clostridia bacterium]|nr:nickel pincer cofactor biosynthesis protein LarB [Clostridia bacterium]